MAASHSTSFMWRNPPSRFRRFSRVWLYLLVVLLLVFTFHGRFTPSKQVLSIRPGELTRNSRDIRPEDDKIIFAQEPRGPGTFRDIRDERFYTGGTWTLDTEREQDKRDSNPLIYDPYPDYNGEEWRREFLGTFRACEGPRGETLMRENPEDMMSVYPGVPKDFPPSLFGSYSAMGLDPAVCTNRHSRLEPYGYETNSSSRSRTWQGQQHQPMDWDSVRWGDLQVKCFHRNADRYSGASSDLPSIHMLPPHPLATLPRNPGNQRSASSTSPQHKERSLVVLRGYHDLEWTENLQQSIRSLVMELSLHSGGEYEVVILCHVRDRKISIDLKDPEAMEGLKSQYIPPEFVDMTILFSDETLEGWYPKIEEHSTRFQYWQPTQILSQVLGEFDYYWQIEMDSRFTGHAYHFLEQAGKFAKEQPRKYLWERNAYFYIPGAYGTWKEFMRMVEASMTGLKSIWGPEDPRDYMDGDGEKSSMQPVGPKPPVSSPEDENYQWGVGEEGDLITFIPIFDPVRTQWVFPNDIWGVNLDVPRKASPVAMGRISKTLVHKMHTMQTKAGLALASEMTPATVALWHGLKAVHVPQPMYADGKWSPKELGRIFNTGTADLVNGCEDSIWNFNHQWDHIMYRLTYMFTTQTGEDLYRRWMGFKTDPNQYTDGAPHQDAWGLNWFDTGNLREDLFGPLCYPSMLLHPVKNTEQKKGKGMAVPV